MLLPQNESICNNIIIDDTPSAIEVFQVIQVICIVLVVFQVIIACCLGAGGTAISISTF